MKRNAVWWLLILTMLFAALVIIAQILLEYSVLPNFGNLLLYGFHLWAMAAIGITIYFFIKKLPVRIVLIPVLFFLLDLPFTFVRVRLSGVGGSIANWTQLAGYVLLLVYTAFMLRTPNRNSNI